MFESSHIGPRAESQSEPLNPRTHTRVPKSAVGLSMRLRKRLPDPIRGTSRPTGRLRASEVLVRRLGS